MVALRKSVEGETPGGKSSEPAGSGTPEKAGRAAVRGQPTRDEIASHHLMDETRLTGGLIERAVYTGDERRRTAEIARQLVTAAREDPANHVGIDAFMREYGLSSEEGILLLCLAEALLRIPDAQTADQFIAEKIASGHWDRHRGHSDSLFVNASTWGLMLTGRLVKLKETQGQN
ncbi:MAG: hypothetical protein ABL894_09665, partial [Hyphomicrobium sp.]